MNRPLLSVACIAFNQEAYIAQAIEGMLSQKIDFPIEIILHDDASTDRTAVIIQDYAARYPELIRPLYQVENVWSKGVSPMSNFVLPACRGRYVAFCEGDDFWTDPYKLARQVAFLENHPDYVLSHTNCISVDEEGRSLSASLKTKTRSLFRQKSGRLQRNLLFGNFIMTLTAVFRWDALMRADAAIKFNPPEIVGIDYTLFLELTGYGKVHYDPTPTAAYRVLRESASHSINIDKRLKFIQQTRDIAIFFNKKYKLNVDEARLRRIYFAAELAEYARRKMFKSYGKAWMKGVTEDWFNILSLKNLINLIDSLVRRD